MASLPALQPLTPTLPPWRWKGEEGKEGKTYNN